MSTPLSTLARLLLRASAAASESVDAAAAHAFGIESMFNRCIRESTRAREILGSLDGRSMAILVQGLGIGLRMEASNTRLAVSVESPPRESTAKATVPGTGAGNATGTGATTGAAVATATVKGTPLALLSLLRAGSAGPEALRATGVRLSGDAQTAEAFAELLRHARPDLEEELSRLIGDIAAHEVAGAARRVDDWARQAGSAMTMNTSEFLQEEARQLPPRVEVDAFGRDVDRLRDDVERSAQRLAKLEAFRRRRASEESGVDAVIEPEQTG